VPNAAGGQQPLCAVYRRGIFELVGEALHRGEYKIGRLFSRVPTRIVPEQEIVAAGFSAIIFENVNTPDEYDRLLRQSQASDRSGENRSQ